MNIILFDRLSNEFHLKSTDFRYMHITNILHLNVNDTFKCGEWGKSSGVGTIKYIDKNEIVFKYEKKNNNDLGGLPLTVMLGALRPIALKRIVKYFGQLGVTNLYIFPNVLSEKSYLKSNVFKSDLDRVNLDGAMLSSCASKMRIEVAKNIWEAIEKVKDSKLKIILEKDDQSLKLNEIIKEKGETVFAIASERGWVKSELKLLKDNGFITSTLGNRVYSTELACIASVLMYSVL